MIGALKRLVVFLLECHLARGVFYLLLAIRHSLKEFESGSTAYDDAVVIVLLTVICNPLLGLRHQES
jgi:hypothetical protein